ncbi:hypothetical protein AB4452_04650 [Vibrio lentus]
MKSKDVQSDTKFFPPNSRYSLVHESGIFWNGNGVSRIYDKDGVISLKTNNGRYYFNKQEVIDYLFNDGEYPTNLKNTDIFKSGVKGIVWVFKLSLWEVKYYCKGTYVYVGRYDDLEEAKDALRKHKQENPDYTGDIDF